MLHITAALPPSPHVLEGVAEGFVRASTELARRRGGLPHLYAAGVVYRREARGHDDWQLATSTLARRRGDCEDLAIYRATELRLDGHPALVRVLPTGHGRFHAVVQVDGHLEDPSRICLDLERRKAYRWRR